MDVVDDLKNSPSMGKRIVAGLSAALLVINVGGWASAQIVGIAQMRTEVAQLRESGPVALKAHTDDAMAKFVNQETRLIRLETIEEQNSHRLTNIERDVKDILREIRNSR